MRQEFLDMIKRLKADSFYAITVVDDLSLNRLITTATGAKLVEKHGSIESFFELLKQKGVQSISVSEYKKNGSGFKSLNSVINNLRFSEKQNSSPVQTPAGAYSNLNSPNTPQVNGLGYLEAKAEYQSNDITRLQMENTHIKEKNESLQKQLEELKEERLAAKYDINAKAGTNDLIATIISSAPALMGLLKGDGGSALNAPANTEQDLPENKQKLIHFCKNPSVSDKLAESLFVVATKITTIEGFYEELEDLLIKH